MAFFGASPVWVTITIAVSLVATPVPGDTAPFGPAPRAGLPHSRAPYAVIYDFQGDPDGQQPVAPLIKLNGLLYGTTEFGGGNGGTVYSINPKTGVESVICALPYPSWPQAGLVGETFSGGTALFGTSSNYGGGFGGSVFEISSSQFATSSSPCGANGAAPFLDELHAFGSPGDGWAPTAPLLDVDHTLYGEATNGGSGSCTYGCGIVFSISPSGVYSVLHYFQGPPDGEFPSGGLINVRGVLYGTTQQGGSSTTGRGTVFSLTRTGVEKVLFNFPGGVNGDLVYGGLTYGGGKFYGTTYYGGTYGQGTVYSLTPGGLENVVYSFKGSSQLDGTEPEGDLTYSGGSLYGTTVYGGANQSGTVFRVTTAGAETVLHSFGYATTTDGWFPMAGLLNDGGTLYGTTSAGGSGNCSGGCGTIFAIKP